MDIYAFVCWTVAVAAASFFVGDWLATERTTKAWKKIVADWRTIYQNEKELAEGWEQAAKQVSGRITR